MANAVQTEDWNGEIGAFWASHTDRYDAMLSRLTSRLVGAAKVAPTDRVLDVGCGCGETTRIVARLASAGMALGVDLSAEMIGLARRQADRDGLGNARFQRADAQVHQFPEGDFDLVLSRAGVMFFDDPLMAFANLHWALRSGGRLALLCWQEFARNDMGVVPLSALAAHVTVPDRGDQNAPGPFSLADPDRIRELLLGAGYQGVRVDPVTEPVLMGANADDATTFWAQIPAIRAMLVSAKPAAAARAIDAVRKALTAHERADGVWLGSAAWLVTASRRP